MEILGIDIGGSGIKGAVVDTAQGLLLTERFRIETPEGAHKADVRDAVKAMIEHFGWTGPVGFGFPAVVSNGIISTASNIDSGWIGTDLAAYFGEKIALPLFVLNDADAAALAEMAFGNGRDREGVVLLLTIGTGIGSAVFFGGHLIPNMELGQLLMPKGIIAEKYASAQVRKVKNLTLKEWALRFNKYLMLVENYINPDTIILGGGISRKFEKFSRHLTPARATLLPALLENNAGIIGAALYAANRSSEKA